MINGIAALALATMLAGCQSASNESQPVDAANAVLAVIAAADDKGAAIDRERAKADLREKLTGCAIGAFATEGDPKGLNVRSAPSVDSPILGVLNSLIEPDPHAPDQPPPPEDQPIGPNFNIVAIEGQWIKIADIDPVVAGFDRVSRKRETRRNYQGTGWVHRSGIAVDPGFHEHAYNRPYFQPGRWQTVDENAGDLLALTGGKQGMTADLISCQLNWLQMRYTRQSPSGDPRVMTGWFKMRPVYFSDATGCDRQGGDCRIRRNPGIWD